MSNKIKFSNDSGEDYQPSDSDNDFDDREKSLLTKLKNQPRRKGKYQKNGGDVLAFDSDEDNDDEGDYDNLNDEDDDDHQAGGLSDSDIDDGNDRDLPDSRAWGKNKRTFYSTDFVDQDYSTYNEKEEQLAEQEEAEAREIQLRLAKQLDDADFKLDIFGTSEPVSTEKVETTTIVKSDLRNMSKRQKIQLFKSESPEFDGLAQDFLTQLETSSEKLVPLLEYFRENSIHSHPFIDFIQLKNELILNYTTNIAFYVYLKSKRISIKNHPIAKRLVQMKQLLSQLEEKFVDVIEPQIEKLLDDIKNERKIVVGQPVKKSKDKKKLKILQDQEEDDDDVSESEGDDIPEPKSKKIKLAKTDPDATDSEEEPQAEEEATEETVDEDTKRGITYQMAKNKGLTPRRKKEDRNPRVKHRNKYKKALVRRKGAHRTVRKEIKKYSGEMSGIKATVRKGIKIK